MDGDTVGAYLNSRTCAVPGGQMMMISPQ